jgi:hypothetical protein
MKDVYTKVTSRGLGSRTKGGCAGVVAGIVFFIASFGVLYWNEGRVDMSAIAKNAIPIAVESVSNTEAEGQLVSGYGKFVTSENIGDDLYLKPGNYLAVQRKAEIYAWVETKHTDTHRNTGGSDTTTTTYTYETQWVENVQNSDSFEYPAGHTNPVKIIESLDKKAGTANIGAYAIKMDSLFLPTYNPVSLDVNNTIMKDKSVLADNTYIFVGKSSFAAPQVGDMRVSYYVLPSGLEGSIFAKKEGANLFPYIDKDGNKLYRILKGTRDEGISQMHSEYLTAIWAFRIGGFFMMWIGLMLLFGPISIILDILPIAGSISRGLIGGITFVVSLALSLVTIIISAIFHNVVAVAVVAVIGIILAYRYIKNKFRQSAPAPVANNP